jgi:hypothetical protein
MEQPSSARGRWAFRLTALAFAWGMALLVAAFVLPVYGTSVSAPSGASPVSAPSTLVGVNGLGVLVPVGLPALFAAVIWFALHRKCSRGSRASDWVASALIVLLAGFCVVAIASIGLLVAPLVALLAGARSLTPAGARPGAPSTA